MRNFKFLVIVVSLGALGVGGFLWLGMFDVAADKKHWQVTEWVLGVVRDRAIDVAADDIQAPSNLSDKDFYVQAAGNFQEMCSACHLAPGVKETELSIGMYPQPPNFTTHTPHEPVRTFWVIKHGLKMTGMPAWGPSHTDEDIWKLVAFVSQLNNIDQAAYLEMVKQYSGSHAHADDNEHMDGQKAEETQGHHGVQKIPTDGHTDGQKTETEHHGKQKPMETESHHGQKPDGGPHNVSNAALDKSSDQPHDNHAH